MNNLILAGSVIASLTTIYVALRTIYRYDNMINENNKTTKLLMKAIIVLLDNDLNEGSEDNLREMRKELNDYLIYK